MSNFSQFFNTQPTIDIEGKTHLKTPDLLGKKLTINEYSLCKASHGDTAIVIFNEYPDGFWFASKTVTDLLTSIENAGKHKDLAAEGMAIILGEKENKTGTSKYITVEEA